MVDLNEFRAKLAAWGQRESQTRGLIIVGSRARRTRPADEWSDLDVIVLTTSPESLLNETEWLNEFGRPRITFVEAAATGDRKERRALFDDGFDVDFIPFPAQQAHQMAKQGIPPEVSDLFERGVEFLVDKEDLEKVLRGGITGTQPPPPPSQKELTSLVGDFFFHVLWLTKKLRRGEIWAAKMCCDCYCKQLTLKLIEWHARSVHGAGYDTWFRGRFLNEWCDLPIRERLPATFAAYDENDLLRAVGSMIDLFRSLAREVAQRLALVYPDEADQYVCTLIRTRLFPQFRIA